MQTTLTVFVYTFFVLLMTCSTTANLVGYRNQKTQIYGGIKHLGIQDHKNTGITTYAIAGKSKSDNESLSNCIDQIILFPFVFLEWFVDFPFSLIADTLVLPYTIPLVTVRDLLDNKKDDIDKIIEAENNSRESNKNSDEE